VRPTREAGGEQAARAGIARQRRPDARLTVSDKLLTAADEVIE
jgi:hypothetical protein